MEIIKKKLMEHVDLKTMQKRHRKKSQKWNTRNLKVWYGEKIKNSNK